MGTMTVLLLSVHWVPEPHLECVWELLGLVHITQGRTAQKVETLQLCTPTPPPYHPAWPCCVAEFILLWLLARLGLGLFVREPPPGVWNMNHSKAPHCPWQCPPGLPCLGGIVNPSNITLPKKMRFSLPCPGPHTLEWSKNSSKISYLTALRGPRHWWFYNKVPQVILMQGWEPRLLAQWFSVFTDY